MAMILVVMTSYVYSPFGRYVSQSGDAVLGDAGGGGGAFGGGGDGGGGDGGIASSASVGSLLGATLGDADGSGVHRRLPTLNESPHR